jgi:hypothetical protein
LTGLGNVEKDQGSREIGDDQEKTEMKGSEALAFSPTLSFSSIRCWRRFS